MAMDLPPSAVGPRPVLAGSPMYGRQGRAHPGSPRAHHWRASGAVTRLTAVPRPPQPRNRHGAVLALCIDRSLLHEAHRPDFSRYAAERPRIGRHRMYSADSYCALSHATTNTWVLTPRRLTLGTLVALTPLRTERTMTEDHVRKNASFRPRIDPADPAKLCWSIDRHACSSSMVLNLNVLEKVVRAPIPALHASGLQTAPRCRDCQLD
jgi:hypothetical protein